MIPTPIHSVLAVLRAHGVDYLLTGGQACVLYGAAEFSRDIDITVLVSDKNLRRLRAALRDLGAEREYVPPFDVKYLQRGHTIHFRCAREDVAGLRLDIMTKMRDVAPFSALRARRTTLEVEGGLHVDLLALPDLVASKKTRRDKDWPMLARLVEANYAQFCDEPNPARVEFWLRELRTPELLIECAARLSDAAKAIERERPATAAARVGDVAAVRTALKEEEARIRAEDEAYWEPLLEELEQLRHAEARRRRKRRT